jgi:arginine deiminase
MHNIQINSEIGHLKAVITHTPGIEVEKMTPENAERALYSDILNLTVAHHEYKQFKGALEKYATCFEVKDLLSEVLQNPVQKSEIIQQITRLEDEEPLFEFLMQLDSAETARQLIEGVEIDRNTLFRYLSNERYSLHPLHNFFFTRDASVSIHNRASISKMASKVRMRETLIMKALFDHHHKVKAPTFSIGSDLSALKSSPISLEGGDVLVVRHDILLVGLSARTTALGIDSLVNQLASNNNGTYHIIIQELPKTPESFIHLDMVFTLLDVDRCMVYEPVILTHNRFRTIHIELHDQKVHSIRDEANLTSALSKLNIHLKPIKCGGTDLWNQEREQWHSGANFLALAPGVIIGYERNSHTLEELSNDGFNIVKASDLITEKVSLPQQKTVITIAGSELARGGGGARCMSMPVFRENVNWNS